MHSAIFVVVNLSARLFVTVVDCAHMVRPIIIISSPWRPMILVSWGQILSSHSDGMTFKFKVKYKRVGKNVVLSIKQLASP